MNKAEMTRRLKTVTEAERVSMHKDALGGNSGYAVAGYDRKGLKVANAVFAWIENYGGIVPTDQAIA